MKRYSVMVREIGSQREVEVLPVRQRSRPIVIALYAKNRTESRRCEYYVVDHGPPEPAPVPTTPSRRAGGRVMSAHGTCPGCGKADQWLMPLHGDKGGPLRCFMCAGEWNAKYTRRRKWGRIIIKAMNMYLAEGGSWSDLDKLKLHTCGSLLATYGITLLGYESAEYGRYRSSRYHAPIARWHSSAVHPDRHAPEQQELAKRVTQDLLALRPFVFPAPKAPEVEIDPTPRTLP